MHQPILGGEGWATGQAGELEGPNKGSFHRASGWKHILTSSQVQSAKPAALNTASGTGDRHTSSVQEPPAPASLRTLRLSTWRGTWPLVGQNRSDQCLTSLLGTAAAAGPAAYPGPHHHDPILDPPGSPPHTHTQLIITCNQDTSQSPSSFSR